jgi:hypothetical protein
VAREDGVHRVGELTRSGADELAFELDGCAAARLVIPGGDPAVDADPAPPSSER